MLHTAESQKAVTGLLIVVTLLNFLAAKKYKPERKSEAYKGAGEKETDREDFGRSFSDVWLTIKTIFTNPVWILLTISGTVESGAVIGFAAFLPKVSPRNSLEYLIDGFVGDFLIIMFCRLFSSSSQNHLQRPLFMPVKTSKPQPIKSSS